MKALLFFLCVSAVAQTSGTISGTVYNLDGEGVPNAPVQATNARTNATYK